MKKTNTTILLIAFISIAIISLYGTFAMINNQVAINEDVDYVFTIGALESQEILVPSNTTKTFDITIENPYQGALNYGLAYLVEENYDVTVGVLNTSSNLAQDSINENEKKTVSLIIPNDTDNDVTITISLITGYINGGDLILPEKNTFISKTMDINDVLNTNLDESGANRPVLESGMIPVYYDETDSLWHKADSSNTNSDYQWYDYNNKKWANVVLVKSESLKSNQKLSLGDTINQEDILAYLVWIPRFKYQVWDIENSNETDNFYYDALNDGINITFESATASTGKITCNTVGECSGENGQDYTHPAFKLGDTELSGFWIGKFETTGSIDNPTILPNYNSLTFVNISEEYKISKLFTESSNYNLNQTTLDSHIIRDQEWSAVAYLTNSVYGLCNGAKKGCRNVYQNNSLYYNTGSSSGSSNDTSNFGTYSYEGKLLDEFGIETENIDKTIISSTTGNIYGVYDMAGGAYETVLLTNDSDNSYLKNIDSKYYSLYSGKISLGEIPFDMPEQALIEEENWLLRGGTSEEENSTIFNYKTYNGDATTDVSFRIVIS